MTLLELLKLIRQHLTFVIAVPVICAIVVAFISFLFLPNTYTATSSMYVITESSNNNSSVTNNDLSASQQLANDVAQIVVSDRVEDDTAAALGLGSLKNFSIDVTSSTSTRVITLSVTGSNPQEVAEVANELVSNTSIVAQEAMGVQSVNAIDIAQTPTSPSGPNRTLYILIAFIVGLFVAIAIIVLLDMLNTRIRDAESAEELLDLPVLGRIPAMK